MMFALLFLLPLLAFAGPREHFEEVLSKDLGHPVSITSKGWSAAPKDKADLPESLAADVANEIHYFMERKPDSKAIIARNLKTITVVYSRSGAKDPELKWVGTDLQIFADPVAIDRRWSGAIQAQVKKVVPEDFAGKDQTKESDARVERAIASLNRDLTGVFHEKKILTASVDWPSMKPMSPKDKDDAMARYVHLLSGIGGLKVFIGFKTGRAAVLSKIDHVELRYVAGASSHALIDGRKLIYSIPKSDLGNPRMEGPTREELLKVFGVTELKN